MEQKQHHRAIVAMGANVADAERNFDKALGELAAKGITLAQSSRRLWTEPIASKGVNAESAMFLNSLIVIDICYDFDTTAYILKEVERKLGATKADKQRGVVAIDLDILSYDGERHHPDDWQRNYIQTLIQDLQ